MTKGKLDKDIERARERVTEAQESLGRRVAEEQKNLLNVYREKIDAHFPGWNEQQIVYFIRGLENLMEDVNHPDIVRRSQSIITNFSYETAREIREKAGLTQKQLGKSLRLSPQYVSQIETGRRGEPSRSSKKGKAYLTWLAKQGYNPFGLQV